MNENQITGNGGFSVQVKQMPMGANGAGACEEREEKLKPFPAKSAIQLAIHQPVLFYMWSNESCWGEYCVFQADTQLARDVLQPKDYIFFLKGRFFFLRQFPS